MNGHCCESMARQMAWHCDDHEDAFDCPDALVSFNARSQEYGLIVHDGGTSVIVIDFCPWCGSRLSVSQRGRR
ncbi:hypothetical protein HNP84_003491 [Thermocatellispora tengchongensis]|uniref:DUF6980 domain-containing protein n=1 Tax=Thermocatellispora tengchongensis TaxID=1073253 RepID=A0A840PCL4_9ACTN|nr:hypothetical protein [Thermocatellispora tengchongensis]MBB5133765.1 hypothetical protein [Thermocatellispora tengchongensis]